MPLQALSALANSTPQHSMRWRPGLGGACHSEVFACSREAAGAGAALALAFEDWRSKQADKSEDGRAVLWVQTREAARLTGRPYRPGLPAELAPHLIHVLAGKPEDALFALEEGVRCREVAFVIGEMTGNPRALDFTASRRLTLTAERHGVPLYLVRLDAARDLSSARMRWDIRAAVSLPPEWNPQAPGAPSWHAALFRARAHPPGELVLRKNAKGLVSEPATSPEAGPPRIQFAVN
jgi:protein ImuA